MPIQARREYLAIVWARYQEARTRAEKGSLLDEIVKNTGLHRDHAGRLMRAKEKPVRKAVSRKKGSRYADLLPHLSKLWRAMGRVGGRKMRAAMLDWLPFYEADVPTKQRLYNISASGIDRLLKPVRAHWRRTNNTGTRAAKNRFKSEVPIRPLGGVFSVVGFIEIDTVAHCGDTLAGNFFWTLTAVEMKTRWTEIRPVWRKEKLGIRLALDDMESKFPFRLKGIFCDCGSEFLNSEVVEKFVKDQRRPVPLEMGRSRPYHKNDQAFVEQKNNTHVRHLMGYGRFGRQNMEGKLQALFEDWCELQNFFVPQISLVSKIRVQSKIKRRYSEPMTPFDRILADPDVSLSVKAGLIEKKITLNPFVLRERVKRRLQEIHFIQGIAANLQGRAAS